jgi:hypothetical protein
VLFFIISVFRQIRNRAGMKQGKTFNRRIETAMHERVQELIRKYEPGPFFEDWVNEFTTGFKKFKWNSEKAIEQAMPDCFFWIECLLKTWREDIGPCGKQANFPKGKDPVFDRTSACQGDEIPFHPLLKS